MKFGVLGPLTVFGSDGAHVQIRGRRLRALLAVLLMHAGKPVSVHHLVDAVWDGDPPKSYLSNLHTYVSRLRERLPGLRIDHVDGQYLLRVAPGDLDLHVFRARVDAGRLASRRGDHAQAADLYRSALALWRDRPVADLDIAALEPEFSHCEATRLIVFEDRFEAELAAGRHVEVVGELEAAVVDHPTRERLCRQLMIALCGGGRQADALAAYRTTRDALVQALGLEPSPALRRLHQEILRGDVPELTPEPKPEPVAVEPVFPLCQLPPDTADFAGRGAELEQVVAALREDAASVPVVVLTGEPGVGKTALAIRVAHRLRAEFPDGQLFVHLAGTSSNPKQPRDVLGGLLRALCPVSAVIPEDLEERTAGVRACLADRRVLVVLDDAASAAGVRALLPGTAGCAVLVTGRKRLNGLAGSTSLAIPPFTASEGRALLGRIAGQERIDRERDAADQVVSLCGGVPLAVRIAGTRLAARRHLSVRALAGRLADEDDRLDELAVGGLQVRAAVARSYESLGPLARAGLRRLALLGPVDVAEGVVAAVLDVADADGVIEELVQSSLLAASGVDAGCEPLYRLPELLRVYGVERADRDDRDAVCAAHR
ncbi:AfsR/SARP family transcriptional regulator [Saccharothrix sp. NRRL B-16314]|uniref:AfsR/SARP family transcriptional regulator n=1 Tax=Saccharothrix sp. NRRL B-16314 TaxID=1463825 RepID=UPI0018CC6C72|nr:BTAD domain-containing putative transcriptional regulator [Saccharothrix sp. NRRL B-16314]